MLKDDAVQKQAPRIDAIKIQGGGGRGGLQNYRTLGTALHAFLVDSPGAWEAPYKCPCGSEHPRGGCAPPPPAPTLSFPAPPSRCSSSARRMRCVVELTLCGGGRAFKRCAGLQPFFFYLGLDSIGAVVPQVPLTPMDTGPGALERACADFYN